MSLLSSSNEGGEVKEQETDLSIQATDVSEIDALRAARKNRIIASLRYLGQDVKDIGYGDRLQRMGTLLSQPEQEAMSPIEPIESTQPTEIIERYRISTKTLIILLFLFVGAGVGIKFVYEAHKQRLKAACELLQKGQPLPDAPNEVRIPDADSLSKLIEICEQNHNVDITYGCAAKGVLHTAGLNHEPSEISETLRAEALRVAEEVQCNQ